MSTVDNRVVRMEFDNQKFESGVSTTMKTLSKLKEALNFKKGNFDDLQKSANAVSFNPLSDKIFQVQQHFSFLSEFVRNVFDRISNKVIDTAVTLGKAFTIEPLTAGFQEYETQMNAVQTIMANTQAAFANVSDKEHLGAVNAALDELNTYADKTIYNFTEMTRNIGTFTAAGVSLDTAKSSIQGIANLAAVSGSNSQQASTAMYQLSQAIAAGSVKLQDWNSVVNAGMGGQVFQDALKKTAREHGIAVDAMIEKHGSFRESLQEGWISAEVLTDTLKKMTDVGLSEYFADVTGQDKEWIQTQIEAIEQTEDRESAIKSLSEKLAENGQITAEDAKQYLDLMITAQDAATKVKTFSQLIDTVKESLGSGWTQSMEYILGDFEEAKELWSGVYKEIDSIITPISNARNQMLKFWHDAGGRTTAINAIGDAWQGVKAVMGAVSDAFHDVFPPMTGEMLVNITNRVADMAQRFKEFATSSQTLSTIRNVFSGLFSVIKMGISVVTGLFNATKPVRDILATLASAVFDAAGRFGSFLTTLGGATGPVQAFADALGSIGTFVSERLSGMLSRLNAAFSGILGPLSGAKSGFDGVRKSVDDTTESFNAIDAIRGVIRGFVSFLSSVGKRIADFAGNIGKGIPKMFDYLGSSEFRGLITNFNAILTGGLINSLKKFVDVLRSTKENASKGGFVGFLDSLKEKAEGVVESLDDVLGQLKDSLSGFTNSLNASALLKVGLAIGVLTASIAVLANIDPDKMANGIVGIATAMGILIVGFKALNTGAGAVASKGIDSLSTVLIKMGVAVGILAIAVKSLSGLSLSELAVGLVGIGGAMALMVASVAGLSRFGGDISKSAKGMITFAAAIRVLAASVTEMSSLSIKELTKGLIGVGVLLAEVVAFSKFFKGNSLTVKSAASILTLTAAIKVLESSVTYFASMDWSSLARGLTGVGVLLAELAIFSSTAGKSSMSVGTTVGILTTVAAIKLLESSVASFASMNWDQLLRGLAGVAALLASIGVFSAAMKGHSMSLEASLSIGAITNAVVVLGETMQSIGGMSVESLIKGLAGLAGSLTIMGVALKVLGSGSGQMLLGAAAITVLSVALRIFVPVLQTLAGMSVEGITKSLLSLAAAFVVLGVGAAAFGAFSSIILLGSAALAAIGAACLVAGAGLLVASAGITAFAAAMVVAATAIVTYSSIISIGITTMVTTIAVSIAQGIVQFTVTLLNGVTQILAALGSTIHVVGGFLLSNLPYLMSVLSQIVIGLLQVASNAIPQFVAVVSQLVIALIRAIVTWLPPLAQTLVTGVITLVNSVANGIRNNAEQILAAIRNILSAAIELVITALADIVRLIPGVGPSLADEIEGAKDIVRQTLAPESFEEMGEDAVDGMKTGFQNGGEGLQDTAGKLGDGVFDSFALPLSDPEGLANEFTSGITSELLGAEGEFGDAGTTDINAWIEKFSNTEGAEGAADDVIGASLAGLGSRTDEFGSAGDLNIGNYFNNFSKNDEALTSGTDIVSNNLLGLNSKTDEFLSSGDSNYGTYDRAFSNERAARTTGEKNATSGVAGLNSRVSQFMSAGAGSFNTWNSSLGKFGEASKTGSALSGSGASGAQSRSDSWRNSANANANAFINKLANTSASGGGGSLSNSGAGGARGKRSSYESAGTYVAGGFNWGVAAPVATAEAARKGAELAASALSGILNKIKAASPSKVTKQYGRWTSEGFIIGIEELTKYAARAGANLGQETVDAIAVSAEAIYDFAKSDYDIDPTIRPVLDLSDIQNGVSKANGLIGSIGSTATIGFGGDGYARSIFSGLPSSGPMQGVTEVLANQNTKAIEASQKALTETLSENSINYDLMADAMLRGMASSGYRIELNDREVGRVVMGVVRSNV